MIAKQDLFDKSILLYDGECSFCNGAVQWFIKRNTKQNIYFASIQGDIGQFLIQYFNISKDIDSLIFVEHHQAYIYSSAALRAFKHLHLLWPMLQILLLVPSPIRNFFYKWFAKNRYRLFGKQQACMIPTPEIRARYLD